jgi:DNA-binding HxlR family transcriptional regulator
MALRVRKSKVAAPPPECPLAACMELLAGAWTPNIIWYLRGGPRRFGELRRDIPAVSAKVLAARLRGLEEKGVVHREVMATSPPSVEYRLSALGSELLPAIDAIVAVAHKLKLARTRQSRATRSGGARAARAVEPVSR